MCGRYAATANPDELVLEFEVDQDRTSDPVRTLLANPQSPPAGTPDYNLAPTKLAPVVLTRVAKGASLPDPVRQLRLLTWGLVPSWSKDPSGAVRMINARAESAAQKPAFAKALATRRALIPAAGWFEWQPSPVARDAKGKPVKQPFFIHRGDGSPLALAGLYEFWRTSKAWPTCLTSGMPDWVGSRPTRCPGPSAPTRPKAHSCSIRCRRQSCAASWIPSRVRSSVRCERERHRGPHPGRTRPDHGDPSPGECRASARPPGARTRGGWLPVDQ